MAAVVPQRGAAAPPPHRPPPGPGLQALHTSGPDGAKQANAGKQAALNPVADTEPVIIEVPDSFRAKKGTAVGKGWVIGEALGTGLQARAPASLPGPHVLLWSWTPGGLPPWLPRGRAQQRGSSALAQQAWMPGCPARQRPPLSRRLRARGARACNSKSRSRCRRPAPAPTGPACAARCQPGLSPRLPVLEQRPAPAAEAAGRPRACCTAGGRDCARCGGARAACTSSWTRTATRTRSTCSRRAAPRAAPGAWAAHFRCLAGAGRGLGPPAAARRAGPAGGGRPQCMHARRRRRAGPPA